MMSNACFSMILTTPVIRCSRAIPALSFVDRCVRAQTLRCSGHSCGLGYGFSFSFERNSKTGSPESRSSRGFSTTTSLLASAKRKGVSSKPSTANKGSIKKVSSPPNAGKPRNRDADQAKPARDHRESNKTVRRSPKEPKASESEITWRDYWRTGGMPLKGGELSSKQIKQIFGDDVPVDLGNYLINVVNWRRQSGSLVDEGLELPPDMNLTQDQAVKALNYLRTTDPDFDEEAAARQWIEEETEKARLELQQRSTNLGIYKKDSNYEDSQQGTAYGRERHGESALEQERKKNEAAWEKEQALKAQQEKQAEAAAAGAARGPLELSAGVQPGKQVSTANSKQLTLEQRLESRRRWREELAEKAMVIKDGEKIPDLTVLQRLGPSFLMAVAVVGLCVWISDHYKAVPNSARIFPDTPPHIATLATLTAAQVFFFFFCRYPPAYWLTARYFSIAPVKPYAASLVGAMFQHETAKHLAGNMLVLWLVGSIFHDEVGRGNFLAVLLGCGTAAGFVSLSTQVLRRGFSSYILGSSNAMLGAFAAMCAYRPTRTTSVFGYELPFSVWVLLAVNLAIETWGLLSPVKRGIDFVGHISGQLIGIGAGVYLRSKDKKDPNKV